MFCDQCGAHLQTGQAHCVRCGKSATGQFEYGRNRVREHVKLVGILWTAYSALHLLGGLLLVLVGKFVIVHLANIPNGPPPEVMEWLPALVSTVGWLILVNAGLGVAVGWGLLQREEWARTFALVLGFLAMLNVPIGTALGIYTVWVLLPSQSEAEYREMAAAA
ncbi:MAG: AtpZ/AtpI family protein [Terriglobales bacterium]